MIELAKPVAEHAPTLFPPSKNTSIQVNFFRFSRGRQAAHVQMIDYFVDNHGNQFDMSSFDDASDAAAERSFKILTSPGTHYNAKTPKDKAQADLVGNIATHQANLFSGKLKVKIQDGQRDHSNMDHLAESLINADYKWVPFIRGLRAPDAPVNPKRYSSNLLKYGFFSEPSGMNEFDEMFAKVMAHIISTASNGTMPRLLQAKVQRVIGAHAKANPDAGQPLEPLTMFDSATGRWLEGFKNAGWGLWNEVKLTLKTPDQPQKP